MSKNGEFDHGSGHRFGLKKVSSGYYKSCCGFEVESGANMEYEGSDRKRWFVQHPQHGLVSEHDSLKDARASLENSHTSPRSK